MDPTPLLLVFTLDVDDFGIKFFAKDDATHLLDALRENYSITVDPFDSQAAVLAARWVDSDQIVFFRSASRRWVASSAAKNLIPKSSTARVEVVGRVVCVQRPGVCATGK